MPSPMMAMLLLRLKSFDEIKMKNIVDKLLQGEKLLTKNGITVPGCLTKDRNFWLYPIIVEDKIR